MASFFQDGLGNDAGRLRANGALPICQDDIGRNPGIAQEDRGRIAIGQPSM